MTPLSASPAHPATTMTPTSTIPFASPALLAAPLAPLILPVLHVLPHIASMQEPALPALPTASSARPLLAPPALPPVDSSLAPAISALIPPSKVRLDVRPAHPMESEWNVLLAQQAIISILVPRPVYHARPHTPIQSYVRPLQFYSVLMITQRP